MYPFNIMKELIANKLSSVYISLSRFLNNIWFLISISWIIFDELCLYYMFKNYDKCIYNLTNRLSKQNILYVKIFQAVASFSAGHAPHPQTIPISIQFN